MVQLPNLGLHFEARSVEGLSFGERKPIACVSRHAVLALQLTKHKTQRMIHTRVHRRPQRPSELILRHRRSRPRSVPVLGTINPIANLWLSLATLSTFSTLPLSLLPLLRLPIDSRSFVLLPPRPPESALSHLMHAQMLQIQLPHRSRLEFESLQSPVEAGLFIIPSSFQKRCVLLD